MTDLMRRLLRRAILPKLPKLVIAKIENRFPCRYRQSPKNRDIVVNATTSRVIGKANVRALPWINEVAKGFVLSIPNFGNFGDFGNALQYPP